MNKRIIVLIALVAAVFLVPASTEMADEVEICGTVMEGTVVDLVWDATNFAAFWYDLDNGISTEELRITGVLTNVDRTICMDALTYITYPEYQQYWISKSYPVTIKGDTGYFIEGWMAEKYVAVNGRADILSKLLLEFEGDDEKILYTGKKWSLSDRFALELLGVDDSGNEATLQLLKDDVPLEGSLKCIDASPGVSDQKRTYIYTEDLGGEDDVPVFHCYVAAVFKGDFSYVQLTHAFLIDNDIMGIDTGDTFGIMEVTTASSNWVRLTNKDDAVELSADTTEHIMGDMYFKTADDEDVLRFYPFVERTIGGVAPTPPPATIPATDTDGDGVPDVWDADNSTPAGYWVNPHGIGRMWGDMNGDGWLTSVDALMILQAAAGKTGL